MHFQTTHKSVRVNLMDQNEFNKIKCADCEYECRYNKQLQKHFKNVHGEDNNVRIYNCDSCPFTTIYVGHLWEHVLDKHPGKDKEFAPKTSKDVLLNILAEQNMDLMEEVRNIKNGMKDSFNQLAKDFDITVNEINEKAEERDQENKELIRKLCKQVEQLEESVKGSPTSTPCTQPPPVPRSFLKTRDIPKTKQKTAYQSRKKVLYVADSSGRNLKFPKIEANAKCTIKTAKAYSAAYDNHAKWPESNFTEVVNQELMKQSYDTLVMIAPVGDITNLDTNIELTPTNKDSLENQVKLSSKNMFSLAERSLYDHPDLKKVILMEHPPRFDLPNVDPHSVKPDLAKLANITLGQYWLNSPLKDRIVI